MADSNHLMLNTKVEGRLPIPEFQSEKFAYCAILQYKPQDILPKAHARRFQQFRRRRTSQTVRLPRYYELASATCMYHCSQTSIPDCTSARTL
jgi:hypothetical protein